MTDEGAADEVLVDDGGPRSLVPTTYLREMAALLRDTEPELWSFFAGTSQDDQGTAVRSQLLQRAVRLEADDYPWLHDLAARAATALDISDPISLYQSQGAGTVSDHGNASCLSLPGEAHIVFSGRLLEQLDELRLLAVLGHELAHHRLWQDDDAELRTADRMLWSAAVDADSLPSHAESARRFALHVETSADRAGLLVTHDLHATVEALVSVSTGLTKVAGAAYLRQASEVLAQPGRQRGSEGTHPELYVRARALELWANAADRVAVELEIAELLRSEEDLDGLDLLDQHRLTALTRRLIGQVLRPPFLRTEAMIGHAGLFGATPSETLDERLAAECASAPRSVQEYLATVLLDMATCDQEIDEVAMARTLVVADHVGLAEAYEAVVVKELDLGVRAVRAQRSAAPGLLERAGQ